MRRLELCCGGKKSYEIWIEKDLSALREALRPLSPEGRKAVIVTDENVAPLYLSELLSLLRESFLALDSLVLPAGEENKTLSAVSRIYERAVEDGIERGDFFLALGGGVVGDITGFAAATYLRGIRFLQIPTTLLAQVDSAIGGKTGVDFQGYKNMVGAFHMPSLVYSPMSVLRSLDERQYASGLGEVMKHALIRDRDYYDFLIREREGILLRDEEILAETVYRSDRIKKEIVEEDPREEGIRRLLNFGHTLGHAIESCSDFQYSHGQCVAFGSLLAERISAALSPEEERALMDWMEAVGLSVKLRRMDIGEILSSVKKDKKMDGGRIRFILLRRIGEAYIENGLSEERMREALLSLMEEGSSLRHSRKKLVFKKGKACF